MAEPWYRGCGTGRAHRSGWRWLLVPTQIYGCGKDSEVDAGSSRSPWAVFKQERDTVVRIFTRPHSLLWVMACGGEEGAGGPGLAGATSGVQVRAGGLDQGAGSADGEKWLEPHISVAPCYLHNKAQAPQSGIEGL